MSDSGSVREEIKEQTLKVVNERTFKQKVSYFFFYYKFHIVAFVIILAVIINIVHTIANKKVPYLQVAMVNAYQSVDYDAFFEEYQSTLDYDTNKMKCSIDPTYIIATDPEKQNGFDTQAIQRIFYATASGKIDVLIADEYNFKWMAESGYFKNFDEILNEEQREKYSGLLLNCKVSSNADLVDEISGIEVDAARVLKDGNWYPDGKVYVGIVMESERIDASMDFIEYLFN